MQYSKNEIRRLDDADSNELKRARHLCADIARHAAGNFYYAFLFLPREQRYGIQALYAFCRAGDDAADNNEQGRHNMLDRLTHQLDLCYEGYFTNSVTLALADSIQRFDFPHRHFDDLFLGLKADLTVTRYNTFDELRTYCYRVATTIGLLCLKIFDADTDAARRYSENLSIGMQLTNILRDIKEDLDRDRIYLPLEDLKNFGINDEQLFSLENKEKLTELIHWEAQRAESFYAAASAEFPKELRKQLIAASIMGTIYRTILHRIMKAERYDKRITLTKKEKLSIAYRIFANKQ